MPEDEFEAEIPSMEDLPPELAKMMIQVGEALQDITMHASLDVDQLEGVPEGGVGKREELEAASMAASMAARCSDLLDLQSRIVNYAILKWDDQRCRLMGVACIASIAEACQNIINGAAAAVSGGGEEE